MSDVFSIRLFGKMEARANGMALPGLHLREGERLLAYLTLHSGILHTYRQLALLFWPSEAHQNEEYDGGSYPSTRQAIYSLRRALGAQAWRLSSSGKSVVAFDLTGADVDVVEFERLVQGEEVPDWRRALELYTAPLLADWHESWVKDARIRSQRSADRIRLALASLPPFVSALAAPSNETIDKIGKSPKIRASSKGRNSPGAGASLEADGGAVALNSPFYIERAADEVFREALLRQDSIVLVKGARQIGKTSLLARGIQHVRQAGARVLLTDFHSLPAAALASADLLYRTLAQEMADQLDMDFAPEVAWNPRRSANRNLERFLCDTVLGAESSPLVWAMDEVDLLFTRDCSSEVFGLFRSWHNRRALDPEGPWSRLTLAMSYATEAHLFIRDVNQSPFNVGTRLTLRDFTCEQVAELNRRYDTPLKDAESLQRFYTLLNGHPFLTRRALSEMRGNGLDIGALEAQADRTAGLFGDHLRRLIIALTPNTELTDIVRAMLRGEPCSSEAAFYRLRSAGVLAGDTLEECQWRCPIYATYLKRHVSDIGERS